MGRKTRARRETPPQAVSLIAANPESLSPQFQTRAFELEPHGSLSTANQRGHLPIVPTGSSTQADGKDPIARFTQQSYPIQRKMTIGPAHDAAEQEADRVAAAVTRSPGLQRKTAVSLIGQSLANGAIVQRDVEADVRAARNPAEAIMQRFDFNNSRRIEKLRKLAAKLYSENKIVTRDFLGTDRGSQVISKMITTMTGSASKQEIAFASKAMQNRFGLQTVEGFKGGALAQMWQIMETMLPEGHVKGNDSFKHLKKTNDLASSYSGGSGTIEMSRLQGNLKGLDLGTLDTLLGKPFGMGSVKPGSALAKANSFTQVVLHEIGHAVDQQLKIMDVYGHDSLLGGWKSFENQAPILDLISDYTRDPNYDNRINLQILGKCLRSIIEQNKGVKQALETEPTYQNASWRDKQKMLQLYRGCKAVKAAKEGNNLTSTLEKGAWYASDKDLDKLTLNGRIFHKAYRGSGDDQKYQDDWVSYQFDARVNHKVSNYQWRAPGEWFAEIYASYYLGALPNTHPVYGWFTQMVNNNPNMSPQAVQDPAAWRAAQQQQSN